MKKLLLFAGLVASFASCRKEKMDTPAVPVEKKLTKIVSVYDGATSGSTTIDYDAQGRLITYRTDNFTDHFTYVSATSFNVTERKNSDNSINQTKEVSLDASGRITRIAFKNAAGIQTYLYEYFYNADGRMIKRKGSNSSGVSEYNLTINNGNVTGYTLVNDGVLSIAGEITHDAGKPNKGAWVTGAYWPSATWFGKRNDHLVAEVKTRNGAGVITYHARSNYVVDADGYPVSVTSDYLLEGKSGTDTYTYE